MKSLIIASLLLIGISAHAKTTKEVWTENCVRENSQHSKANTMRLNTVIQDGVPNDKVPLACDCEATAKAEACGVKCKDPNAQDSFMFLFNADKNKALQNKIKECWAKYKTTK